MRKARITRILILFTILLTPASGWCQGNASTGGEVLTLERAVELALENNRDIENATLEVKKAGDAVAVARTYFFPEFDFSVFGSHHLTSEDFTFKKGVFGDFPIIGPIPAENTKIRTAPNFTALVTGTVSQPLSQLYGIVLGVRQRKVIQQIAEEQLRSQEQKVADQVKEQYYGILQTQSELEATDETIIFLRELDSLVERNLQVQRVLKAESLEVKAKLAKAEYDAFSQRNTLATQKEQLNYLLGRDVETAFTVDPVPGISIYAINQAAAQAIALEQRPEVRAAKLNVERTQIDYSIVKTEYIPEISVQFRYTSNFNIELLPENTAMVGLFVEWEFFDWGRKQDELAEKRKSIIQAKNDLKQAEDQVVIDVNIQIRKLEESRELVHVTKLAQAAAREKLRVIMNKYAEQTALLQEVLHDQASLADANSDYQQAVLGYWTARANLEKALGEE